MEDYVCIEEFGKLIQLETYGVRELEQLSRRSHSFFSELSKKAMFITSVPFYWFLIFKYLVGWFNSGFFIFVIASSLMLSMLGGNWGIMELLR